MTLLIQVRRVVFLSCLYLLLPWAGYAQSDLTLWYKKPAARWVEALPVGNGHLGGMVFGGIEQELIQLNESTLYSGGPVPKSINPTAATYLPQVREALLQEEDYGKANTLLKKMQGLFTESYLPLGDIVLKQDFKGAAVTAYHRELDIGQAIATTRFTIGGITYTREVLASAPRNVLLLRLRASKPHALTVTIAARSPLRYTCSTPQPNELVVSGKAPAHVAPNYYNPKGQAPIVYADTSGCNGMRFQYRLHAVTKDGSVRTDTAGIQVTQATEVLLYVAAATSFNGFDKCPDKDGQDEKALAATFIRNVAGKSYATLQKEHVADYQQFFNRVSFSLTDTTAQKTNAASLPTDKRLQAYTQGAYDPALETLYFQFGRYLLISSSRPGGPPANLQGIWNKELRAPWSANYTININTEMNYWPAELTNLTELHQPLLNWIQHLAVTGARTAREFYGARGWVAHHNSEIWATSNPVGDRGAGDPVWAAWTMGGNWLCQHLWEHYAFTQDKDYLAKQAYPVMKQAALFTLDWLVTDKNGYLVTAPSTSPENSFKDKNNTWQAVSVASTMDMAIIWDLFTNLIEASQVLGIDADFRETLLAKRAKLYPVHVGSQGQLLEWYKDFPETDPQHRHVSHLFGLHPGRQLSASQTPDLFQAARKTLEIRGDGGTGWSKGWKINWWARLHDGDHAYTLIRQLLHYTNDTTGRVQGGGTYPNLFDAHPPFQIDGNFAGTAGMAEMLLQSQLGEVQLLPALPAAWPAGSIRGLKARGNFDVSMTWRNHRLQNATITSRAGSRCVLRAATPFTIKGVKTAPTRDAFGYFVAFATKRGKVYQLIAQ